MTKEDIERKEKALFKLLMEKYINGDIDLAGIKIVKFDAVLDGNLELANAVQKVIDYLEE